MSRLLLLLLVCATARAAEPAPAATPRPGLLSRTWTSAKKLNPMKLNPFHGKTPEQKAVKEATAMFKGLEMKMTVDPAVPNLGDHKQLNVTLRLTNKGKKLVQLDFPSTQRIEVLAKNSVGKVVEQWSEDQSFEKEPSLVTINSGERLEYHAIVSTRDFAAGQEYTIEGFFPNYDMLRSSVKVVPVR